ncbi:dihydrodipicolinate synthase family protein [Rhodoplanes sp. TEM]|uniref:Dihydrodipicolinate synthase family protein n=1 Tax=Rhodoplanes tepidamans TaxID=200616 RepID=A0ABT5J620_RHOTP|nr:MULTISPECIES: dihydrodipicolinate synthase family protein [Rhodoplanes]MDC7785033.1 dihydrodipicolinate synthase family protein [Rhodoplanes tepidamans]MDC7982507.1 dihydrodipicolinate synthase family protein [Rhodoplanes sp. TEM]MDQ0356521.1 4-hydroxy-tetrahydrodipicolinate synthase [Rhodoplanes tepidamans]
MSTDATPTGVFPATLTPVDADGEPNAALLAAHCRALLAEGATGFALLGTTGEANSLTPGQRMKLLEDLLAQGFDPTLFMPGTGNCAMKDAVALTRHALDLGCRGVVALPPFYYTPVSDDALFAVYARLIETVGHARPNIVLYHIPPMSRVPIVPAVIERLIEAFPGAVVGVKDSSGELANMTMLAKRFPQLSILAGADPLMLPLLREGGAGAITATSNVAMPLLAYLFRNFADPAAQDKVAAAQALLSEIREVTRTVPQIAALRALAAVRRGDPSWSNALLPNLPLTSAEDATLRAAVAPLFARMDGFGA